MSILYSFALFYRQTYRRQDGYTSGRKVSNALSNFSALGDKSGGVWTGHCGLTAIS